MNVVLDRVVASALLVLCLSCHNVHVSSLVHKVPLHRQQQQHHYHYQPKWSQLSFRTPSLVQVQVKSHPSSPTRLLTVGKDQVEADADADSETEDGDTLSDSDKVLLQAKLSVLEDVVNHLNVSQLEDQKELERLQSQVLNLEQDLEQQQTAFDQVNQSHQSQLQQQATSWQEQEQALNQQHAKAMTQLERKLLTQSKLKQDEITQQIRKETSEWKTQKEQEWNESLQIATASVTAAETREQALQDKLDLLESRYHQEAAQYKTELDQLQKEWKTENGRLEKELGKLHKELSQTKQKRDQETTYLIEELGNRNQHLQEELNAVTEQIKFQKLQHATQIQLAKEEWTEQRDKERKFYQEAIRLLKQEKALRDLQDQRGFWRRIFRFKRNNNNNNNKQSRSSRVS